MSHKPFNVVLGVIAGLMVLSLFVAMSASSFLRNDPKAPDPATGHTIPLALRGLGTRYMTQQEWNSIAWYWDIFYALIIFLIIVMVMRITVEAYSGFMQGWRSEGNRH